jgi:hypothetical protein
LLGKDRGVRRNAIVNLSLANKYDLKAGKVVGASFVAAEDRFQDIDWCYVETPWTYDAEIENRLAENYPFRPVNGREVSRYDFD